MWRSSLAACSVMVVVLCGACRTHHTATSVLVAQTPPQLHEGDLLFQDLDCGPLCDAIEAVTEGVNGKDFSHVGIAAKVNGRMMVVEAIGTEVHAIDQDAFFLRSDKVVVGRPLRSLRSVARRAAHEAIAFIGTPYDDAFLPDNDKLYCSELVALSYERANHNTPFFATPSMTFKDPRTGAYFPAWVEYYAELHLPVPEGLPGCNPGGLSREPSLKIVWRSLDP
jgi:Permuted papain-like amidase enzyme, YaeF/YiiX, C92 family